MAWHRSFVISCFRVLLLVALASGGSYADDPLPPYKRVLGKEDAKRVAELEKEIAALAADAKFTEAIKPAEEILRIRTAVQGKEHRQTVDAHFDLEMTKAVSKRSAAEQAAYARLGKLQEEADGLKQKARYRQAEPLLRTILDSRRQVLGEAHPDTANSYTGVAINLNAQGKYAEAQTLYEKSLAIDRQVLGETYADTAQSYSNAAGNLHAQGKYAQAQLHFEKAFAIRRQVLGTDHPDTALSCNNMAFNLYFQGKTHEAIPLWQEACKASDSARLYVASTGFERALHNAGLVSPHEALAGLHEPAKAWQYAEAYLARGLLDDLDPESRKTPEAPARLAKLDEHLVPLLGRSNLSPDVSKRRDAMLQEREALFKTLAATLAERATKRVWALERVQPTLPADAAVVLWLDVRKDHWACIIRHTGQPIWQRLLGTSQDKTWTKEDNLLTERTYAALIVPSHPERDKLLAALRAQRLDPLLPHLEGVRHLLVVPTDNMAKMPIEALTDRFTISYIPSASVYAQRRKDHRPLEGHSLLALGHPIFSPPPQKNLTPPEQGLLLTMVVPNGNADKHGLTPGDILLSYNSKPLKTMDDLQAVASRTDVPVEYWCEGTTKTVRLDPGRLGVVLDKKPAPEAYLAWKQSQYTQVAQRSGYSDLPGTKVEVEALARLIPQARLLLGSSASEQTLEQMADSGELKNYRLLHFATHGEVDEGIPTESALILAQDRISQKLDDRITRTLSHKKPLDGRLTVGTILDKWQLDADQVVLSACETGLGAKAGGEGLLGFAYALLLKGAKSVVLSRWKVSDDATALLMKRYYKNIMGKREGLKSPMPRAEGLREAKLWLRNLTQAEIEKQVLALPGGGELRGAKGSKPLAQKAEDKPFAAPYYWAAFVLIGDPD